MEPQEHQWGTTKGHLHATEYPGEGPAVVMAHGYPDDSRIYDRLVPELAGRHLVTFDFLGHGRSGRELTGPLEPGQRVGELASVVHHLGLERPVLLGHDISGPVVIRYALENPGQVGGLVLLNTFFGDSPTLEFPEFIRLLADPHLRHLADEILTDPQILGWMLLFTDRRLNQAPTDPAGVGGRAILPQFFGDAEQKDAIAAIRAWTATLFPEVEVQNAQIAAGDLAGLDIPVSIAFGEKDPYFDRGVATHLYSLFSRAKLESVSGAAHWPQWDQPAAVAAVVRDL